MTGEENVLLRQIVGDVYHLALGPVDVFFTDVTRSRDGDFELRHRRLPFERPRGVIPANEAPRKLVNVLKAIQNGDGPSEGEHITATWERTVDKDSSNPFKITETLE